MIIKIMVSLHIQKSLCSNAAFTDEIIVELFTHLFTLVSEVVKEVVVATAIDTVQVRDNQLLTLILQ